VTARHKAGQEEFKQEIDRLMALAREAESADDFALAAVYYQHALDLIADSGADTELRPIVEAALQKARSEHWREERLLH